MPGTGNSGELQQIAPHPVKAVLTGVTEQIDLAGRFAMAPVVIGVDRISCGGQFSRQAGITGSRFTHAVSDLQDSPDRSLRLRQPFIDMNGDPQRIGHFKGVFPHTVPPKSFVSHTSWRLLRTKLASKA
ncbi:hypothetical protein D3C81_1907980 [compost metagenome]